MIVHLLKCPGEKGYSEASIIRPGRSRLLELEKEIVLVVYRDFFQISRPGCLIETVSK